MGEYEMETDFDRIANRAIEIIAQVIRNIFLSVSISTVEVSDTSIEAAN